MIPLYVGGAIFSLMKGSSDPAKAPVVCRPKGKNGEPLPPQVNVMVTTGLDGNGVRVLDFVTPEQLEEANKKAVNAIVNRSNLEKIKEVTIPAAYYGLEAVDVPTRLRYQLFTITSVDEEDDGVTITAQHVFYEQSYEYTTFKGEEGTNYSASAVIENVMTNTIGGSERFEVETDSTDQKPGKELDYARKSIVEAFLDPENGICKKFGLSLIRDNYFFYCLKNVGYDRGYTVEYGKNLLGVEREENIENTVTRLAPYAKDRKGNPIWLTGMFVDSTHITDYAAPRVGLLDTGLVIGKDGTTDQNVQDKLRAAAQKEFDENHVDIPEVTMTVDFLSMGDTEEYSQYRGLDKVYLYDIITIKDRRRGYNYSAQVVGIEHDIVTGQMLSVTIGNLNNSDGVRKIATWQVPEVNGENIRLQTILAGSLGDGAVITENLQDGAITHTKLAVNAVEADNIKAGEITADKIDVVDLYADNAFVTALDAEAISAVRGHIDDLVTQHLTTDELYANLATIAVAQITTANIVAANIDWANINSLQTSVLNAVDADITNLQASVLRADIASIATAEIGAADISVAKIKDLQAQNFIAEDAVTHRYYIDKLMVNNAQLVHAVVGDLVVKASDGNYYSLDVDPATGACTATLSQVTQGEINAGVTSDGKATIIETDLTVSELSASNFKGLNALIDKITASRIDVDELYARQAFINKLNTTDISGNTSIQIMVNAKNATYTMWADPATVYTVHDGDTWNKRAEQRTHAQMASLTHAEMSEYPHWAFSKYDQQYVRVNGGWDIVSDWQDNHDVQARLFVEQERITTEVNSAVSIANDALTRVTHVETIVSEDGIRDMIITELTTPEMLDQIITETSQAAIEELLKERGGFHQWETPTDTEEHHITAGALWYKDHKLRTHAQMGTQTHSTLHSYPHKSFMGGELYMYSGTSGTYNPSNWVLVSDEGTTVQQKVLFERTTDSINAEVTRLATSLNQTAADVATLKVQSDQITAQVTSVRYTADRAYQQQAGILIQSDGVHIKASASSSASGVDITFDGITLATNRKLKVAASDLVIGATNSDTLAAQLATLASLDTLVQTTGVPKVKTTAFTISGNTMTMSAVGTVVVAANKAIQFGTSASNTSLVIDNNGVDIKTAKNIALKAGGTFTINSGNFSVDSSGNVSLTGTVNATSGTFSGTITAGSGSTLGGWTLTDDLLYSGSGDGRVALDSKTTDTYAIWAGKASATQAPFRVKRDGSVYLTKLIALDENNQETTVNLRQANLWKLSSLNVKTITVSENTMVIERYTGGSSEINFNGAAQVTVTGTWGGAGGATYTALASNGQSVSTTVEISAPYAGSPTDTVTRTINRFDQNHKGYVNISLSGDGGIGLAWRVVADASSEYTAGRTAMTVTHGTVKTQTNIHTWDMQVTTNDGTKYTVDVDTEASDAVARQAGYTSGYSAGSPSSIALGAQTQAYEYAMNVTKGDGTVFTQSVWVKSIFDTARDGYTKGVFSEYTGQKYRISNGQYSGTTLYRRETNPGGGYSYSSVGTGFVQVAQISDTLYTKA